MNNAANILKERLAKGELSVESYRELLELVGDQKNILNEKQNATQESRIEESDALIINYNDKLSLYENTFSYYTFPGVRFSYDQISHLRCNFFTSTLNFIPTQHSAEFTFGIGGSPLSDSSETKWVKIASQKTKFLESKEQKELKECYKIIQKASYKIRQKYYLDFFSAGQKLKIGNIEISRDGIFTNLSSSASIDLRIAKRKGEIAFGTHYGVAGGNHQFDPNQLYLVEEKKFFNKKKMVTTFHNNSDVIFPIIAAIAAKP